jgi:adenine C2-methylase RlmN of 23S rRNA A2503 and tRNA A37
VAVAKLLSPEGAAYTTWVLMGSGEPLDNYEKWSVFLRLRSTSRA